MDVRVRNNKFRSMIFMAWQLRNSGNVSYPLGIVVSLSIRNTTISSMQDCYMVTGSMSKIQYLAYGKCTVTESGCHISLYFRELILLGSSSLVGKPFLGLFALNMGAPWDFFPQVSFVLFLYAVSSNLIHHHHFCHHLSRDFLI